jgi:hypothetical protein
VKPARAAAVVLLIVFERGGSAQLLYVGEK